MSPLTPEIAAAAWERAQKEMARSEVTVERTVSVSIGSRGKPEKELVLAFLNWQIDNDVMPLQGTGSSGLGRSFATFPRRHRKAIERFFAEWERRAS